MRCHKADCLFDARLLFAASLRNHRNACIDADLEVSTEDPEDHPVIARVRLQDAPREIRGFLTSVWVVGKACDPPAIEAGQFIFGVFEISARQQLELRGCTSSRNNALLVLANQG